MENLLNHRCNIQKRTATENDFGEPEYAWTNLYTNVPCRFSSPKGGMVRLPTGEHVTSLPKLFLKASQEIAENNRIVGISFDGTFEILMVNPSHEGHGKEHHKEVELKKVVAV